VACAPKTVVFAQHTSRSFVTVLLATDVEADDVCQLDFCQSEVHNERGGRVAVNIESPCQHLCSV
jgi:hypothetical protein